MQRDHFTAANAIARQDLKVCNEGMNTALQTYVVLLTDPAETEAFTDVSDAKAKERAVVVLKAGHARSAKLFNCGSRQTDHVVCLGDVQPS